MEDVTEQVLSRNRAGSRERPDSGDGHKRALEWSMLAESSHEMVSQSGMQGKQCDENEMRRRENKLCFQ